MRGHWWCGGSGARVGGAAVCSTGELRLGLSCDHSFNEHVDDALVLTKTDILLREEEFLDEREMINESFLQMRYWVTKTTNCSCIWFKTS